MSIWEHQTPWVGRQTTTLHIHQLHPHFDYQLS